MVRNNQKMMKEGTGHFLTTPFIVIATILFFAEALTQTTTTS